MKAVDENRPDAPGYQEVAVNGSADRMVISGRLKTITVSLLIHMNAFHTDFKAQL